MANTRIKTEKDLQERLATLREKSTVLEKNIVGAGTELYNNMAQPSRIIKECARDLANDGNFLFDMAKVGMRFFSRRAHRAKTGSSRAYDALSGVLSFFADLSRKK